MHSCRNRKVCLILWLAIAQAIVVHAIVPAMTLRREAIVGHLSHVSTILPAAWRTCEMGPAPRLLLRGVAQNEQPADEGQPRPPDRCRRFFSAFKATLPRGPLVSGFAVAARSFDELLAGSRAATPTRGMRPEPARLVFASLPIVLCRPRC